VPPTFAADPEPVDALRARRWYAVVVVAAIAACLPAIAHAFFDLDDYRYLLEARDIEAGRPHALVNALVVENRWDEAWWVPAGTVVRFFRPLVAVSYWVDARLWGADPRGYVVTNVALHLIATGLFYACLRRMLGRGRAAFIAALAFGVHGAHWESLAYVAGRTDTLATIPFLAAILACLHRREGPSPIAEALAAVGFFVALLGKEYAIVLPVLLLLLPRPGSGARTSPGARPALRVMARLRADGALLLGCAAALGLYLVIRHAALGESGSGTRPYPYFFLPGRDGFVARTGAALLQYADGLAAGHLVLPFLSGPAELAEGSFGLGLSASWVALLLAWGLGRREGRWFAIQLLITLMPMLILYTSGRYLYIPSLGYCALLGLAIDGCARRPGKVTALVLAAAAASLFVLRPAFALVETSARVPGQYALGLQKRGLRALLAAGPPPAEANDGRPLFLLDFPGDWLEMQFASAAVAVHRQAEPEAFIFLTTWQPGTPRLTARTVDARTIELWRGGAPLVAHDAAHDFDLAPLGPGDRAERRGYAVTVTETAGGVPTRASVRFDQPLMRTRLFAFPSASLVD
jgi:hypothetical protein